jgi:hypothetical protein
MYGEWLYARHTIPYDMLPHYFMEFDIFDRETREFLSTDRRQRLLAGTPVTSVPVLGAASAGRVTSYIGLSRCSSTETNCLARRGDPANLARRDSRGDRPSIDRRSRRRRASRARAGARVPSGRTKLRVERNEPQRSDPHPMRGSLHRLSCEGSNHLRGDGSPDFAAAEPLPRVAGTCGRHCAHAGALGSPGPL